MVMASFSLQVFLLFFSGFRRRYSSRLLRLLLWLAYLSVDSLAVYVLGRLTLRGGGNPLALFWAPFLLLHLGGQETMTAFSMEDNTLWKRHLLSLATQVPMAIYVVGKQLQGDDQWLVAPMVLVFVSGTAKFTERIWALRRAGSAIPGTDSSSSSDLVSRASDDASWDTQEFFLMLSLLVSKNQETDSDVILNVAAEGFKISLHFLMGTTPSISLLPDHIVAIKNAVEGFKSSENILFMAYKMSEINLSMIYDYLYTKFGTRHFHMAPGCIACHRIASLALTPVALGLFVSAMVGARSQMGYDAADVIISFILLVGAIVLETCSIFMSFTSSFWAYKSTMSCSVKCPVSVLLRVARRLHPENRQEWSAKLAQYSLVRKCIQENKKYGFLKRMMRWIGMGEGAVTHICISPEIKKLVLDKLLDISATPCAQEWDIARFQGQWAQWVAKTRQDHQQQNAAQRVLQVSNIQGLEFVSSALLWHIVTDICLLDADDDDEMNASSSQDVDERLHGDSSSSQQNDVHDGMAGLRRHARELSEYIMYLVAHCGAIAGSDGHYAVIRGRREVSRWLVKRGGASNHKNLIRDIRDEDSSFFHENYYPMLDRARRVASDFHQIEHNHRWELIAAVWLEMLCYIAYNCGPAFHAKHLTTGGEFVTHVKMLLFMLGV